MQSAADWLFATSVVCNFGCSHKFSHISSVPLDNKQNKITRTTTTFIYRTSQFAVTITSHKDHVACSGVTVIVLTDRQTVPVSATQGHLTAYNRMACIRAINKNRLKTVKTQHAGLM